ncbi:hypothetical protein ACFXPE_07585, partial [Streptomyces scopuliridis]
MASSRAVPNLAFRRLRARRSPGEFAAAVRRAAREIGEQVACDARYIGRVEAGEIRCPNYAYERVFLHMFPGLTLKDLGFSPREHVRGRAARATVTATDRADAKDTTRCETSDTSEESDVLRRAFMTSGSVTVVAASLGLGGGAGGGRAPPAPRRRARGGGARGAGGARGGGGR